jgi:hypothetical protein
MHAGVFANVLLPELAAIRQDDTHRLIPSKYSDESVLSVLADDDHELSQLYELDGATNTRLIAETTGTWGIGPHELVFGIPNASIVNASFCHPNPVGARFSDALRGAWYAGFLQHTALREVTYHIGKWLKEVHWKPGDWVSAHDFPYVDFLADFRAEFHDIRHDPAFKRFLADDYTESQILAASLLGKGSAGIVYPSVRDTGGTCIACFRPALVTNVRRSSVVQFSYVAPSATPRVLIE